MRAWMIGLVAVAAMVTPALAGKPSIAAAMTAQVYVTGYVDRGYTASGVYTHPGTCAVDPRVIPLGTYITIDGLGTCHAEDTGSAVIGYHVDLWVPTVAQAYAITGWRTATWNSGGTQQVLGYHAVAPTATATRAPVPTTTPPPPSPTPASPTATPILPTAHAATTVRRAQHAHARRGPAQATPTAAAGSADVTATATAGAGPGPVAANPTATATTSSAATAATAATTATPAAPFVGVRQTDRYQGRCHTTYWTVYVAGRPYRYWRTVCR